MILPPKGGLQLSRWSQAHDRDHAMPELVRRRAFQASLQTQDFGGGCLLSELDNRILVPLHAQDDGHAGSKKVIQSERIKARKATDLIGGLEEETAQLQQRISQLNEHLHKKARSFFQTHLRSLVLT